jgi:hypothetical protein
MQVRDQGAAHTEDMQVWGSVGECLVWWWGVWGRHLPRGISSRTCPRGVASGRSSSEVWGVGSVGKCGRHPARRNARMWEVWESVGEMVCVASGTQVTQFAPKT